MKNDEKKKGTFTMSVFSFELIKWKQLLINSFRVNKTI